MLVWRICKKRHVRTAFSGIGAEKHGGRWNRKGERMVYASSSLSLATLELFVHLEPRLIPSDLHSIVHPCVNAAGNQAITTAFLPA